MSLSKLQLQTIYCLIILARNIFKENYLNKPQGLLNQHFQMCSLGNTGFARFTSWYLVKSGFMMKYTNLNKIKLLFAGFLSVFPKCEFPRKERGCSISQNYLTTETQKYPSLMSIQWDQCSVKQIEKFLLDRLHVFPGLRWRIKGFHT